MNVFYQQLRRLLILGSIAGTVLLCGCYGGYASYPYEAGYDSAYYSPGYSYSYPYPYYSYYPSYFYFSGSYYDRHRGHGHRGDGHRGDGHRGDGHRGDRYRGDRHRGDRNRGDRYRGDSYRSSDRYRPREEGFSAQRPPQHPSGGQVQQSTRNRYIPRRSGDGGGWN